MLDDNKNFSSSLGLPVCQFGESRNAANTFHSKRQSGANLYGLTDAVLYCTVQNTRFHFNTPFHYTITLLQHDIAPFCQQWNVVQSTCYYTVQLYFSSPKPKIFQHNIVLCSLVSAPPLAQLSIQKRSQGSASSAPQTQIRKRARFGLLRTFHIKIRDWLDIITWQLGIKVFVQIQN